MATFDHLRDKYPVWPLTELGETYSDNLTFYAAEQLVESLIKFHVGLEDIQAGLEQAVETVKKVKE